MNGKNVNTKTLREKYRLLTNILDEKDYEQLKSAYRGGFTHARIDNNIVYTIVSRDDTTIYTYAKEILQDEK